VSEWTPPYGAARDQDAPRPEQSWHGPECGCPECQVRRDLIAQVRAEERAACEERMRRYDEADRVLGVMAAQDVRRAERERVSKVIAQVRDRDHGIAPPCGGAWRAACDAIEAGMGGRDAEA
jgi:hypothetical protein